MVSYRTILFGTIAVLSATAPAFADSATAVPGPVRQAAAAKTKAPDSGTPIPGPSRQSAVVHGSIITGILQSIGRWEESIFHLHQ